MKIKTKLVNTTDPIFLPERKYINDAGADLRAHIKHPVWLYPGLIIKIPTGVAVEIPTGYVGLIQPRSGASSEGKVVIVGTIESDYRGELIMSVFNPMHSGTVFIKPGERIAQLVILPYLRTEFEIADELAETERGTNGFGSTGRF